MRKIILFSIIQQLLYLTSKVESLIGQNASLIHYGKYQFIASFQDYPGGDIYCTGVLITSKYVITAEYCVEDETPQGIRIVFTLAPGHEGVKHKVDSWTTFVDWSKNHGMPYYEYFDHDIAIVKLRKDILNINPVRLNKLNTTQLYNHWAIMIGWQNYFLHKVSVIILTNPDCEKKIHMLNGNIGNNDNALCSAANPYALMDHGDSGTPLLSPVDNTLLGIGRSFVPNDDNIDGNFSEAFKRQHRVNLHMSVDFYRAFIHAAAWL